MLSQFLTVLAWLLLSGLPLTCNANSQTTPILSNGNLASNLEAHVLQFFRGACDASCCGQMNRASASSLPCCASCDNILHGEALGLPFSIASIPSSSSIHVISNSQNLCDCDDGALATWCCTAPVGNDTDVRICRCPDDSFSSGCCPDAAVRPPPKKPVLCGCGDGKFAKICCGPESQPPDNVVGECVGQCPDGSMSTKCCPIAFLAKVSQNQEKLRLAESPTFSLQVGDADGSTRSIPACSCPDGTVTTKCPCDRKPLDTGKSEL